MQKNSAFLCFSSQNKSVCQKSARSCKKMKIGQNSIYALFARSPSINGMEDCERGPRFWKFNSTLVNDSDYRLLLNENIKNWLEEFNEVVDKRVLWDLLKYKI